MQKKKLQRFGADWSEEEEEEMGKWENGGAKGGGEREGREGNKIGRRREREGTTVSDDGWARAAL